MQLGESFNIALAAIRANKMRSALTLLGIIIGVMTIIAMYSLVQGLQNSFHEQVSGLGANVFQVQKYPAINTGGKSRRKYRNRKDITLEHYYALKERVTLAQAIGAEYWRSGEEIRFEDRKTLPNVSVCGTTPEFLVNNGFNMGEGRFLVQQDLNFNRSVAAIGVNVAEKLFPFQSPLNKEIKIRGVRFRVVGVLAERGSAFGNSRDNYVVIPIEPFIAMFGKERSLNITVQAATAELFDETMDQTIGVMRAVRKVPPGEENDFEIYSNDTMVDFFNNLTRIARIVSIAIASISLLVAGVGIMNILLVSVTERTREIGIRKSIGAKKRNILWQFLVEAIVLCEFGGVIGILLGLLLAKLVDIISPVPAAVPIFVVFGALIFCSLVGVVFGVYPATKAARLDPITALRHE